MFDGDGEWEGVANARGEAGDGVEGRTSIADAAWTSRRRCSTSNVRFERTGDKVDSA